MHVYIHVPFCARRCSYCDFAIAVRRHVPSAEFAAAVEREWAGWQSHPAWEISPVVETIYFGGGTPSRLDPGALMRLIDAIRRDRTVASDAEVTLEANPDDVDEERAAAWRGAGVNRISLGAQSFHPDVLAWMHRTHDAPRIGAAVRTLRAAGFEDLSLDLIYALPAALGRIWTDDLEQALELAPTHLSLYGLTVEPKTPLGRWTARGQSLPLDDERAAGEYLAGHERLAGAGFEHYEVSNAALPGRRARHNSAYWRRAPFIGLGPSAHSGFGNQRRWNVREWEDYHRRSERGEPILSEEEVLTADQVALEDLYLGLRTREGVPASRIPASLSDRWVLEGWARAEDGRVSLTAQGWLRLDALVASLSRC